ncbi:AAC(3) family N-acetyltransferase [Janthinobacterium sp. HLX7-2]|uniref:AAC(3) family N-acetyltransferase n=1 Tax=Janthinobacterium sp. HLX7-2 TaxID=1259331 RepID=UPI003F24112C
MLEGAKRAINTALEAWRRAASANKARQSGRHVTRAELAAGLQRLGIAPGDTLFIHSSLKSLGYVEGGAATVIRALQDAVGQQGTLLLPTYYLPGGTLHATCEMHDYVFDVRRHGTHMGRLPEAFLASGAICRSIHPTHSVSAWGRHAAYLTEGHHRAPSIFGAGSPWQRCIGCDNAKVLGLGISMGPVTFYHALEDAMGDAFPLPIWQARTALLPCLDHAGTRWEVPVRPFDPAVARRRIDHPGRGDLRAYFQQEFDAAGLRVNGQVGDAASWCIPARAFFDHLRLLASENVTIYSTAAQLAARPVSHGASGHPSPSARA